MSLSQLKVGAAKLCISPAPDMFPMGASLEPFAGVREGEDICVRAIAIDNGERVFLMEAFELGGVPCAEKLRARLESEAGLKQENMLITATHNHSAPHPADGRMPAPFGGKREIPKAVLDWTETVLARGVEAARLAVSRMRNARYGFGEGKSFINVNRDQFFDDGSWMQGMRWEGASDKTLAVIKFVDMDGKLIAAVLNYAMHATTSFCTYDTDGKVKVTCDAPGIACNLVEAHFGGDCVALWQSGAAGNQNPYYIGIKQVFDAGGVMRERRRIPGAAYEQGAVFGQQHGMDAIRALRATDAAKDTMNIRTVDDTLYFPTQKFPHAEFDWQRHRLEVDNLLEWANVVGPGEPMPEKRLANMIPCEEKAPMKAQLILLDDIALFGVACELYNEIGLLCKQASPAPRTMIVTHIGSPSVGYVLDDASVGRKVFQSYGLVPAGHNNAIVVNGMRAMFDRVKQSS